MVIKLDGEGHYFYSFGQRDRDNGSIIDFVQFRKRLNLGEVRKELRPWLGKPATSMPQFFEAGKNREKPAAGRN